MIKYFSFILSIYFMALSLMPCTDDVVSNVCDSVKIEQSDFGNLHEHSNHSDDCTPLCSCACCGSFVIIPSTLQYCSPSVIAFSSFSFPYSLNYSFEYAQGTWHPPAFC